MDGRTQAKNTVQFCTSDRHDWHIKTWEAAYLAEECNVFLDVALEYGACFEINWSPVIPVFKIISAVYPKLFGLFASEVATLPPTTFLNFVVLCITRLASPVQNSDGLLRTIHGSNGGLTLPLWHGDAAWGVGASIPLLYNIAIFDSQYWSNLDQCHINPSK